MSGLVRAVLAEVRRVSAIIDTITVSAGPGWAEMQGALLDPYEPVEVDRAA